MVETLDTSSDDEKLPIKIPAISLNRPSLPITVAEEPKHKYNLKIILRHSNATPIRANNDIGYVCFFCPTTFPEPKDLKTHTLKSHGDFKHDPSLRPDYYPVRLDITNLTCQCSKHFDQLTDLMHHLEADHSQLIRTDVKNYLLPFRFDSDKVFCALCDMVFTSFRNAIEHMNQHYRNHICDACDAGFVTNAGLRSHKRTHVSGEYQCEQCDQVCNTKLKLSNHVRYIHQGIVNRHKCAHCGKQFASLIMKNKHVVKEHGGAPTEAKCMTCDEVFSSKASLQTHVTTQHLMIKKPKCSICNMEFSKTYDLMKHMVKHTGARDYICDICQKEFRTKSSIIQHLRVHNDERCLNQPLLRIRKTKKKVKLYMSRSIQTTYVEEMAKHKNNLEIILRHSNATPIRANNDLGYVCFFCPTAFTEPKYLKTHTLECHGDFKHDPSLRPDYYPVRLDITNLTCQCSKHFDQLTDLMHHLEADHSQLIRTDVKNYLLPFRFDSDKVFCALCDMVFTSFRNAIEHMNQHYRNHICDACDAGFVTNAGLRSHKRTHVSGEYQCEQCDQVYNSKLKLSNHVRSIHQGIVNRHKCAHCGEKFSSLIMKYNHVVKEHGGAPTESKRMTCDEVFSSKDSLQTHVTTQHLMLKKPMCSICNIEFPKTYDLKKHMVKHTGARDHKCDVCQKAYRMKSTLIKHLQIHSDEHLNRPLLPITVQPKTTKKIVKLNQSPSIQKTYVEEMAKHKHNLQVVLRYSNATPVRAHNGIGYVCFFCPTAFPEPKDLKRHTLESHRDLKHDPSVRPDYHRVRLDITKLTCQCFKRFNQLTDLMHHLEVDHDQVIHTDVKNYLLSFRFTSGLVKCALCDTEFDAFRNAIEHMNQHYRNHICDVCDAGFVLRASLRVHKMSHGDREYQCKQCDQMFDTKSKFNKHVRDVHHGQNKRHKCAHCGERFSSLVMKNNHVIKVHGGPRMEAKCLACDKVFSNKENLRAHINTYHLMIKKCKCPVCDMKFSNCYGLKMHMVKHTGARDYKCDVCQKAYGRKFTLIQHMRVHSDDRYNCHHCSMVFVQISSLKSHLQSKHGITMEETTEAVLSISELND